MKTTITKWLIGVGVYVVGTVIINAVDNVITKKRVQRWLKEDEVEKTDN